MDKNTLEKVMVIYDETFNTLDGVLVGQEMVKKVITSAILCDTNSKLLFLGNTGMGKTTLANFLAYNFVSERISVTSDMIPSDIQEQLKDKKDLRFLHIDEFNRASGKVQSSFVELLAEKQFSIKGEKYSFKDFYVVATQNSADIAGIFNVPQAVYDRFDVSVSFDDLTEDEKRKILFEYFEPNLTRRINLLDLEFTKNMVDSFIIKKEDENLLMKMFNIIDSLMYNNEKLFGGSNIRAHKFAIRLAKINALADGRQFILPRDIAGFINYIYSHRVNQNVTSIDNFEVLNIFDEVKNQVLALRR